MSETITEEELEALERDVPKWFGPLRSSRVIAEVRRLRERDGQWIRAAREQAEGIERRDAKIEEQAKEIERLRDLLAQPEPYSKHTTDPDHYKPGQP